MKYYIPDLLDAFPPDAKEVSAPDMDKLREDVAKRLAAERPAQKRPRRFGKTLLIAAAAAALLSVTALAAAFGGFDWLRDEVEPEFIDAVEPVEQSVTDEGIRFSVIAAQKYDDMSVYYVSIQDVDRLGRVTEDASPQFLYPLGAWDIEMLVYDAPSQTAVYQLRVNHSDIPAELAGTLPVDNESTLLLTSITYSREALVVMSPDIDVYEALESGEKLGVPYESSTRLPSEILQTGYVADIPSSDGAYVSAVGINHGWTAVQYVVPDGEREISITPYFITADERRVDCVGGVNDPKENGELSERYFDISAEELRGGRLLFEGSAWSSLTGEWKIDVNVDSISGIVIVDIDTENARNAQLIVGPLGICITAGLYDMDDDITSEELIVYTNDSSLDLTKRAEWMADGRSKSSAFWRADAPLDPAAVTEIRIGDTVIELN